MMDDRVTMWVIYDHPTDHPDHYVAREWLVHTGKRTASIEATANLVESDDLESLRVLMFGRINIGRYDDDDPKIVEVWV